MRVVIKQRERAAIRLKAISYAAALKADQETGEAGTDNQRYMTSLTTKQQIDARLADQPIAEAGSDNVDLMTSLRTKQSIDANAPDAPMLSGLADTYSLTARERAATQRSILEWIPFGQRAAVLDGTSTADITVSLQKAFASGEDLFFPRGRYNLADEVAYARQQQKATGQNKSDTRFIIQADANLSANSFIKGIHYGTFSNFTLSFSQNAATVSGDRADIVEYPWAIDINAATHFNLNNIVVERAFNGVNASTGNGGGLVAQNIKMCAFGTGILIDGALHHAILDNWDQWSYGVSSADQPLLFAVYSDGENFAGKFGRIDVLLGKKFMSYKSKVLFFEGARVGLTGGPLGQIHGLEMDGDGANVEFNAATANVDIIGGYGSKTSPTVPQWLHKAGRARVSHMPLKTSGSGGNIKVEGGALTYALSSALQSSTSAVNIDQTGGKLILDTVEPLIPTSALSAPVIRKTAGAMVISNMVPSVKGAGSGTLLSITTDHANDQITLPDTGGWDVSLPTGTVTGYYNIGKTETYTPTYGFATPGTSTFNPIQATGRYRREGNNVKGRVTLNFDITAITGASGAFEVSLPPITPIDTGSVVIGQLGGVGFSAAAFVAAQTTTAGKIVFRTTASTAATGTMTTTEFAVRNGYLLVLDFEYRARN